MYLSSHQSPNNCAINFEHIISFAKSIKFQKQNRECVSPLLDKMSIISVSSVFDALHSRQIEHLQTTVIVIQENNLNTIHYSNIGFNLKYIYIYNYMYI